MKQVNVKIGGIYQTYIGQELCSVEVVSKVDTTHAWTSHKRTAFRVRRVGAISPLPKLRSAAALRE